MQTAILAKTI
jgi:hypothetical protein